MGIGLELGKADSRTSDAVGAPDVKPTPVRPRSVVHGFFSCVRRVTARTAISCIACCHIRCDIARARRMISYWQQNTPSRSDAPLWAAALVLSLCINAMIVLALSHQAVRGWFVASEPPPPEKPPTETVLRFEMVPTPAADATAAQPPATPQRFARTSDDQRADRPERPAFIGDRDTRATSDRAPDADALLMPSQAGIEPRADSDIETTESQYRDGPLDGSDAPENAAAPRVTVSPPAGEESTTTTTQPEAPPSTPPPPAERLLAGPAPVDVPVPVSPETAETPETRDPEEPRETRPRDQPPPPGTADGSPEQEVAERPPATPARDPGFRGNQRKTAIRGSISRTGRSALDVADTALGRYQAQISRAVEQEWQRNCVRHRDFITPGFLTVRFFVEADGRVRMVQFVGEMESGEIQKGFTLNSIRNAEIPPMPPELRRDLDGEPLELIFNFYF